MARVRERERSETQQQRNRLDRDAAQKMWASERRVKCIYEIHGLMWRFLSFFSQSPHPTPPHSTTPPIVPDLSHSLRMSLLVFFFFSCILFLQIIRWALFNFCSLIALSLSPHHYVLRPPSPLQFIFCLLPLSQLSSVIFGVLIIASECLLQVFISPLPSFCFARFCLV